MIDKEIKKDLREFIKNYLGLKIKEIRVERPGKEIHGDYSTNFALEKFKTLREKTDVRTPLELAQEIVKNFPKPSYLEKIEAQDPGFINFYLKEKVFVSNLREILRKKEKYGSSNIGKNKTAVIDYSAPNIAKPFGIGHLRSTIIGQAIYNIYKFLGYKVIGDNHIGDWGTQFGKLIYAIKEWGGSSKLESATVKNLVDLYIRFHEESENNPSLEEKGRFWFKKLEEGDKKAKKIWKECLRISWKEFNRIYKILNVKIDYAFGESFYVDKVPALIKDAKKLDLVKESQGALIIEVGKDMPPVLLLKSDEATTYHSRDLATIKFRQKKFGPLTEIIYEVGADQVLHFQQLFSAGQKFPWGKKIKYTHLAHGLMRLTEGRMRTRKGEIVLLEEVLNKAVALAKEILEKNNSCLSEKEKRKIASIIGVGAVKYNDLVQHYSRNIVFDWNKVLNLQGNSGPYLQYTYTRGSSILKKAKLGPLDAKKLKVKLKEEKEILLAKKLYFFPEVVEKAGKNYSPNLICNYLFELSQTFNDFYESLPVLKADEKSTGKARLILVKATTQAIKNGLSLLGILVPEKM